MSDYTDALIQALKNTSVSAVGEGGRDANLLTGGGSLSASMPVGNGAISGHVGGGGAYGDMNGQKVRQFAPDYGVGYEHNWRF